MTSGWPYPDDFSFLCFSPASGNNSVRRLTSFHAGYLVFGNGASVSCTKQLTSAAAASSLPLVAPFSFPLLSCPTEPSYHPKAMPGAHEGTEATHGRSYSLPQTYTSLPRSTG